MPIIVAMGIALFSLSGLSQLFASYREKGVLRRMRTTPVKPAVMLGAQLLMATILSVVTMVVILAIGQIAFDVNLPRQVPAYLISYLLLALALFAIGLLDAAVAPSSKSASAIGSLVFFPLAFFAGLWLPGASMSDVLRTISHWPQLLHLAVLLAWAVLAGGPRNTVLPLGIDR